MELRKLCCHAYMLEGVEPDIEDASESYKYLVLFFYISIVVWVSKSAYMCVFTSCVENMLIFYIGYEDIFFLSFTFVFYGS